MSLSEKVMQTFEDQFEKQPAFLVRAPGRVNLIGEHTDYNDGFVLPMAINRAVWMAVQPRSDRKVKVYSLDFGELVEFELDYLKRGTTGGWFEYIKGVAWALQEAGYTLQGWEGTMAGDVPIGAGLSSSAALEMATTRAFAAVSDWPWQAAAMAQIGQRAENEWVGMNCGIMDQMISAAGRADHALLIDCRSLESEPVPLPPATAVVVLDTTTRRGLVDSAYNERRQQCEAAARFFEVPALRDVNTAEFEARAAQLDPLTRQRARHVITENERTLAAAEAMKQGDAVALGQLMNASHTSMRDDFEISNRELNVMVVHAQEQESCYGARMTGGGFGGCAVALVQAAAASTFAATVGDLYHQTTDLQPSIYICTATDGATVIKL